MYAAKVSNTDNYIVIFVKMFGTVSAMHCAEKHVGNNPFALHPEVTIIESNNAIRNLNSVRGNELSRNRYEIENIPNWLQANVEISLHYNEGEIYAAADAQEYIQ